ncbi:MAG TPA: helix-turn-helix transcriptional regulator [Acidisarcina sp.]
MSNFGEDLVKEREHQGVSLYKISQVTKISARHLDALEQERFDQLPGGVFNKGIVRGYARVAGLDEEHWVRRYMEAYAASGLLKDDDADWVRFAQSVVESRESKGVRPDMRLRWAGVAALLLLVAGLGLFVWHYVHERISAANQPSSPQVVLSQAAPRIGSIKTGLQLFAAESSRPVWRTGSSSRM